MQLEKLSSIIGVSGYEENICKFIVEYIDKFVDNIEIDNIGNIIVKIEGKKDKKKKIMIISHMDEVGLQVTSILNDGRLKVKSLGSLKITNLYMQRIVFRNNEQGIVYCDNNINNIGIRDIGELVIDCGYSSYLEAVNKISLGEVGTFLNNYREGYNTIIGKALDNRIGCSILIKIIEEKLQYDNDIYFVFTSKEEIGLKGARVATNNIKPDIAVVIDTISTEYIKNIAIGNGVAIKISDSLSICNEKLVNKLKEISNTKNILTQFEVTDCGASELGVIDESGNGVKVCGLSIPIMYGHTANCLANKKDINSCLQLMKEFLSSNII